MKGLIAALGIILFGPPPVAVKPPPPVIFDLPEIQYEAKLPEEPIKTDEVPNNVAFNRVNSGDNSQDELGGVISKETPLVAEKPLETAIVPEYLKSCVAFVRKFSKYNNFPRIASAKDIPALKFSPAIDDLIIFNAGGKYGKHGHVGIVRAVVGDNLVIEEANLVPNKRSTRLIKWRGEGKDEYIKGYFGWDKK